MFEERTPFLLISIVTACLIFTSVPCECGYEITPSIAVSQVYEDNIFLEKEEDSDHITSVTPGISINIETYKNVLKLDYFPTWVKYYDFTELDTVRHDGSIGLLHKFGKRISLNLREKYLKSENIFTSGLTSQKVTHDRKPYERNEAGAKVDYCFGKEDHLIFDYNHTMSEHDDSNSTDTKAHSALCMLTYWFNIKNGIELSYNFDLNEFSDDGDEDEDIKGHKTVACYIYCFNPHTKFSIDSGSIFRNSKNEPEDYRVYYGSIEFEHYFSPDFFVLADGGCYFPKEAVSEAGEDISYSVTLNKNVKKGNISVSVQKGWDEGYLEIEPRKFTEYWSTNCSIDYLLFNDLSFYSTASYRKNDYFLENSEDNKTCFIKFGIGTKFFDRLFFDLDYSYRKNMSDNSDDDYIDNIFMITITALYPFVGERYDKGREDQNRKRGKRFRF